MRRCHRLALAAVSTISLACADAPIGPVVPTDFDASVSGAGRSPSPVLLGTGHHSRTIGSVTALTKFKFKVVRADDGTISGHYKYDFQANGFAVKGRVTCATTSGNQAWVGGVVDHVVTSNPAFESLLGLEMWWRSKDGNSIAAPDSTTGLGFGFPGGTITAESWCRDQPVALVMRQVENADLSVH